MFQALSDLIKTSGLRGVDLSVRLMNENNKISVMLSFNQAGEFEHKLLQASDDATLTANADSVMALRAALNTPLAIIGEPGEIISMVEQALNNLREGVVTAATSYTALDISALLTKSATQANAASNAKTEKTPPAAKKDKTEPKKASASSKDALTDANKNEVRSGQPEQDAAHKAEPKKADEPSENGFSDFDSL